MSIASVSPQDVLESLEAQINRKNVFKAGQGAGASGSFFFFSKDNRFIIKSIKVEEKRVLLNTLDPMIAHLKANSNCLLAKVFGVFTVKTKIYATMDFLIMENVTYGLQAKNQSITFDLKGSTYNRRTKTNNAFSRVLKDQNFLQMSKHFGNKLLKLD